MPSDKQKFSQIEVEILINTPDSGEILLEDSDLGKFLLLGGRGFPDPNSYDPALAARYLDGVDSIRRRGLLRYDAGNLYMLTGKGFEVRKELLQSSKGILDDFLLVLARLYESGKPSECMPLIDRAREKGMPEATARSVVANLKSEQAIQDIHIECFRFTAAGYSRYKERIDALRALGS